MFGVRGADWWLVSGTNLQEAQSFHFLFFSFACRVCVEKNVSVSRNSVVFVCLIFIYFYSRYSYTWTVEVGGRGGGARWEGEGGGENSYDMRF